MRELFSKALGIGDGDVVSLVGSGGKTSLLWRLAEENREKKTLVSTTTKMFLPPDTHYHHLITGKNNLQQGCNLFYQKLHNGKISIEDEGLLADLCKQAYLSLLECDGAKMKCLKGWGAHEPQVPLFTTMTVGVLPVWGLGLPATEDFVHRLPLFCQVSGGKVRQEISLEHYLSLILHPGGLFGKAVSKRVLFFNLKEERDLQKLKGGFLEKLPDDLLVLAGNVKVGTIFVLRDVGE